jgi:hypothetical protein
MNERIKELAAEAWQYANNNSRDGDDTHGWLYRDKFAELIVKESIAMCDELKAQYLTSRKSTMEFDEKQIYAEGEAACDIVKYKMKKQFGVE